MKITIEIPKEFEKEWNKDRFKDSLSRLSADANLLAGKYEKETAEMLIEAFKEAQPEPPWIPVTERLPEKYGWYLCTLKDGRVN